MNDNFNLFSLEGKKILVTGASSGIGRQVAITASMLGATLIVTGRNSTRLAETMSYLVGIGHSHKVANLNNFEDLDELTNALPKLDGIVHCAGIGSRVPCKNLTIEEIMRVMETNFTSPVMLQSRILSKKKINKGASIVFIASRAAEVPSGGNAIYSASKGAIISYSKCLAIEVAPRQIRVNCISPAMIWTPLVMEGVVTEEQLKLEEAKYPLKRYGQPEDVANLCMYLLSDASSWMTGSCVNLTGGSN